MNPKSPSSSCAVTLPGSGSGLTNKDVWVFLQPFDEDYLNHLDPPVKHMSFHAYLRKLTGGADK